MRSQTELIKNLDNSLKTLSEMIDNAKKQGAFNFEMLYVLQDGLNELKQLSEKGQKTDIQFKKKWDKVMGWAPRVFEEHPLLDWLRDIDDSIMQGVI